MHKFKPGDIIIHRNEVKQEWKYLVTSIDEVRNIYNLSIFDTPTWTSFEAEPFYNLCEESVVDRILTKYQNEV